MKLLAKFNRESVCQERHTRLKIDSARFGWDSLVRSQKLDGTSITKMTDLGKLLIVLGAILALSGAVLVFLGKTNLPLGRLPGDIFYRGKNTTVYFPLATSLLLGVVLSIVLYLIGRWRK